MTTFLLDGRTMQDHYWGIGRYVFRLACALAETTPEHRFCVLYNPSARNSRFNLSQLQSFKNVELVPVSARAFSLAEQRLVLHRAVANASLFHAPYYALPYALSKPLVVTLEDVTPLVIPQEMPNPGKRLIYYLLNQLAARRAKRIITISNASRRDIVKYMRVPEDKIAVVPLAAFENFAPASNNDIERVRLVLNLPRRYLLYLGINKPHKNLLRLVQAFAQIRSDAVLVIAGHWDARFPVVQEFVAKNDLHDRILFRHNIAETDLPALLGGAEAFAFPSIHEGFGLPPLEAMACGTPVVCSNASSLPEVVGQAALLFDPVSVQDLADSLTKILDDSNLRARLQQAGLHQAARFSWTRTARETLQVYINALLAS